MALLREKSNMLHDTLLKLVHDALKRNDGNRTDAANELGVTVRCIRYWIAKYDELQEFKTRKK